MLLSIEPTFSQKYSRKLVIFAPFSWAVVVSSKLRTLYMKPRFLLPECICSQVRLLNFTLCFVDPSLSLASSFTFFHYQQLISLTQPCLTTRSAHCSLLPNHLRICWPAWAPAQHHTSELLSHVKDHSYSLIPPKNSKLFERYNFHSQLPCWLFQRSPIYPCVHDFFPNLSIQTSILHFRSSLEPFERLLLHLTFPLREKTGKAGSIQSSC